MSFYNSVFFPNLVLPISTQMKTILVLTDCSPLAENAALYAVRFAQEIKANLVLFNAYGASETNNISAQGVVWSADFAELQKRSEDHLKALKSKLETTLKMNTSSALKPKISTHCEFGVLADLVEEIILKKSIGLIVMGGQHINNFSRLFLGSDTHDLLDKVICPVLIIPEGASYHRLEKITYATDLKSTDKPLLSSIAALGRIFSAEITVTHIEPDPQPEHQAKIQNLADEIHQYVGYSPMSFNLVNSKNIAQALCAVSDTDSANILVLMHKKYHFPESIFHSSISKTMAKNCPIPLLVYPFTYHHQEN